MADTHYLALKTEKHQVVKFVHAAFAQSHYGAMSKFLKHSLDVVGGTNGLRQHELCKKWSAKHRRGEIHENTGCLKGVLI